MSSWATRIVVLVVFVALVGLPLVFKPAAAKMTESGPRLVVITPHNETIRYEFGRGFSEWHRRKYGTAVHIDWRFMGTADIRKQVFSEYAALIRAGQLDEPAGYDVIFGGGDYDFDKKFKVGVPGPGGKMLSILQPIKLEKPVIDAAFPGPLIADKKLYDPEGYWYGVVLSSFGIAYNRDVLSALGLPEPRTWSDMVDGKLMGWVALADPAKSSSINVTYDAILQRYGWERGWKTLHRACANARYFAEASSKVPVDVAQGEAASGMCIDFYGRYQAQVVGGKRVGFVAPADATVVTTDPVGILRGIKGQRLELATHFVEFLLTLEGQALWCMNLDEGGKTGLGPVRYELRRPPVMPAIYAKYADRLVDNVNPYDIAKPLPKETPSYFSVLPTLLHAAAIDIHDELREAWQTINGTDDPAKRAAMEKLFDELPFTVEELLKATARWKSDKHAEAEDRLAWTRFFRERYRRISGMVK
jgi:ABC-type Fe3+ transport system substrate-binding protein